MFKIEVFDKNNRLIEPRSYMSSPVSVAEHVTWCLNVFISFMKGDTTPLHLMPQLRFAIGREEAAKSQAIKMLYVFLMLHPHLKQTSNTFLNIVLEAGKQEEQIPPEEAQLAFIEQLQIHGTEVEGIGSVRVTHMHDNSYTRQSLFNSTNKQLEEASRYVPLFGKYKLPKPTHKQEESNKLLRRIAATGDAADLLLLLDNHPSLDLNQPTPEGSPSAGRTALHWVVEKVSAIVEAADESAYEKLPGYETCFQLLIAHGASLTVEDGAGKTPLAYDASEYFTSLNISSSP